jgi:hypothetical protein
MLEVKKRVVMEERGQNDNVNLRADLERSLSKVRLPRALRLLLFACLCVVGCWLVLCLMCCVVSALGSLSTVLLFFALCLL